MTNIIYNFIGIPPKALRRGGAESSSVTLLPQNVPHFAGNIGDWWAAPARYLSGLWRKKGFVTHILSLDCCSLEKLDKKANIVIGGGGILPADPTHFRWKRIREIVEYFDGIKVLWGVGDVYPWRLQNKELQTTLRTFHLIGLRAFTLIDEYKDVLGAEKVFFVPCASVFAVHKFLKRGLNTCEEQIAAVTYLSTKKDRAILPPLQKGPVKRNKGIDICAVLSFIASGKLVITNSYHGVYWALLFGNEICENALPKQCPKFFTLKYRTPQPQMLEEYRNANCEFNRRFLALANAYVNHAV